jgi:hypothetical protein
MSIQRFVDEIIHPEKKCKRVGHNEAFKTSIWMVNPWKAESLDKSFHDFRYSGVRMRKTQKYCSRCGKSLHSTWKAIQGFNSITLPSTLHDIFTEKGMVEYS